MSRVERSAENIEKLESGFRNPHLSQVLMTSSNSLETQSTADFPDEVSKLQEHITKLLERCYLLEINTVFTF